MYRVIGKDNCSRCMTIKKILESKGVGFEYKDINSFNKEEQENLITIAEKAGCLGFPIILDRDTNIVHFQEIIK